MFVIVVMGKPTGPGGAASVISKSQLGEYVFFRPVKRFQVKKEDQNEPSR